MRSEGVNKRNALKHYMWTPIRILSRARDLYMKSMDDCVGKMHGCGVVDYCVPLPADDKHNLKRLLRTTSKRKAETRDKAAGFDDLHRQRVVSSQEVDMGYGGIMMGRSYGVWLGRIDEDKPCTFEEDELLNLWRSVSQEQKLCS